MVIHLPVSGLAPTLKPLTGAEELALLEAQETEAAPLTLLLLQNLAQFPGADTHDWQTLPASDADVFLLLLRQAVFGDKIEAVSDCPQAECGAKIEVTLSIAAYIQHHAPEPAPDLETESDSEWFRLRNAAVSFRIPLLGDQIEAMHQPDPAAALQRRCVRPFPLGEAEQERVETALDLLAPELTGALQAVCPQCGAELLLPFSPRAFVLREFREQAAFLYADIHALAGAYGWTEAAILALPRHRRLNYAELVREQRTLRASD